MNAVRLTNRIHSKGFAETVYVLCVFLAFVFVGSGNMDWLRRASGTPLPSANLWFPARIWSFAASMAANMACVALVYVINRFFNIIRTPSYLPVALFGIMQLATPDLFSQFYTGTLLALVGGVSMILLFSCFKNPGATSRVFLAFFLVSLASMFKYCFFFFIPVLLIGCAQMRVFTPRSLTAAFLGLITPWWILLGFGVLKLSDVEFPTFQSIFSVIDFGDAFMLMLVGGVTVVFALASFILNGRTTIAYNSRTRSYNGLLAVMTLAAIAGLCADYVNFISYIPLLNFCAAYHVGHYFSAHRAGKSYIGVIGVMALYSGFYICQILI